MQSYVAALTSILIGLSIATATARDTAHRQAAPHVHGVAHLSIAAEGSRVSVELSSPAASLIGYERAPRTDDERATLNLAKQNLMAGDAMIRFNTEAGCRLAQAEIDAAFADAPTQQDHQHKEGHADFTVVYGFECDRPESLSAAALGLFAGFPALERVLVQYATHEGQGGAELTPREAVVRFVPF